MIRVRVELVSSQGHESVREIALLEIDNRSPGRKKFADYACRWVTLQPNGDLNIQRWRIISFERRRWNVWGLIVHALNAVGQENWAADGEEPLPFTFVDPAAIKRQELLR